MAWAPGEFRGVLRHAGAVAHGVEPEGITSDETMRRATKRSRRWRRRHRSSDWVTDRGVFHRTLLQRRFVPYPAGLPYLQSGLRLSYEEFPVHRSRQLLPQLVLW